jgi:hypothetical protein
MDLEPFAPPSRIKFFTQILQAVVSAPLAGVSLGLVGS